MARPVTYSIVDCPDGQFAVVAWLRSDKLYRRGGFHTLAEAEACVEELRELMALCGAPLVRREGKMPSRWLTPLALLPTALATPTISRCARSGSPAGSTRRQSR
ncbi:hypothetical protein DHODJN_26000 [Methylorubrum extorquens]